MAHRLDQNIWEEFFGDERRAPAGGRPDEDTLSPPRDSREGDWESWWIDLGGES
jgi:hypothetical protein